MDEARRPARPGWQLRAAAKKAAPDGQGRESRPGLSDPALRHRVRREPGGGTPGHTRQGRLAGGIRVFDVDPGVGRAKTVGRLATTAMEEPSKPEPCATRA
jgi:hypothetical protein